MIASVNIPWGNVCLPYHQRDPTYNHFALQLKKAGVFFVNILRNITTAAFHCVEQEGLD